MELIKEFIKNCRKVLKEKEYWEFDVRGEYSFTVIYKRKTCYRCSVLVKEVLHNIEKLGMVYTVVTMVKKWENNIKHY